MNIRVMFIVTMIDVLNASNIRFFCVHALLIYIIMCLTLSVFEPCLTIIMYFIIYFCIIRCLTNTIYAYLDLADLAILK